VLLCIPCPPNEFPTKQPLLLGAPFCASVEVPFVVLAQSVPLVIFGSPASKYPVPFPSKNLLAKLGKLNVAFI